ncbi:MAG: glutathione S-transferase family protein [Gammaproteobacteria bacterium]|nr:glutathione S-transferase family protein [Gammaproteobacteria bacterium]
MYKVYGMSISGNCYKVRLLLEQLEEHYEWHEINLLKGETLTPAFLAMNPAGQVPILEIGPKKYLVESNAILCYLAEGTPYLTDNPYLRAQTLSWLFWEQYSHERYIAVARFIKHILPAGNDRLAEIPVLHEGGYRALDIIEQHLSKNDYFVTNTYSIADISLYAYTHCAAEGGFELGKYESVKAWMQRIESQPGFREL